MPHSTREVAAQSAVRIEPEQILHANLAKFQKKQYLYATKHKQKHIVT